VSVQRTNGFQIPWGWLLIGALALLIYLAAKAPPSDDGGDPYYDAPIGRGGNHEW